MPETASNEKKTARIRNVIIRSVLLVGFAVIALSVLLNLVSPAIANKQIAVEYVPLDYLRQYIHDGKIQVAGSIAAIYLP